MKRSISETAKLSGVSVRTLHYYDKIGLLSPSCVTGAGYRFYEDAELQRLQQIMFYRELDFSLKEIGQLLSCPNYDENGAFSKQLELLRLKRNRLDGLIALLDARLKGVKTMSFTAFDETELEQTRQRYAAEVKARWGHTDAYQESEKKRSACSEVNLAAMQAGMDAIMQKFAGLADCDPAAAEVQDLVAAWQQFITEHYYVCTNEILAGLGELYTADQRFRENIDRNGMGTAQLMSDAIRIYCMK